MNPINRESTLMKTLEKEALAGNLESARELAFFERHSDFTVNLDACPAAAEEYEKARTEYLADMGNDDADDDMGKS